MESNNKKKRTNKIDKDIFLGVEHTVIFPKEETSKNKSKKSNIRKAIERLFNI